MAEMIHVNPVPAVPRAGTREAPTGAAASHAPTRKHGGESQPAAPERDGDTLPADRKPKAAAPVDRLDGHLQVVKLYPPYPPDEPRRAAIIRELTRGMGVIERALALAAPAPASGALTATDDEDETATRRAAAAGALGSMPGGLTRPGSTAFLHELS